MYKHLLIATDGSDFARKAFDHGFALAKIHRAKVTVITVTEPWDVSVISEGPIVFPPTNYEESAAAGAAAILKQAADTARDHGVVCDTLHISDRVPADGIVEAAKAKGCDLIVMASHGRRGLRRLVLGSVANEVVAQSATPVLICR